MSFHREYVSLIINSVNHSKQELLDKRWLKDIDKSDNQSKDLEWQNSFHNFLAQWINEDSCVKVHTSGSTGKPKVIQLSKERMMNSAFMTGKYFNFKSGQKALLCLPCDYIAGKMMVVRSMIWGLDLQLVPPTGNPMATIDQAVDFAAMVPMQVANVFEQSPEKFALIKTLIIGGGKIDHQLAEQLQNISTQCYATYGMTETITHVAIKKLNGANKAVNFTGLPNIHFSKDKRGCLTIHAPRLAEEIVITNDLIELKNDQEFKWLGRYDNVINTGGVKVFPEKIEKQIEKCIRSRYFITSLPDKKLENKVILIVEDKAWIKEKIDALLLDLKQVLSKFELPKAIYFVEKFEETPTKKIQRNRTKNKLNSFNL